jgi:hypothetical protein
MWFSQRWGGLLTAGLLLGISLNLLIGGRFLNIVLIDVGLAIAALALSQAAVIGALPEDDHTNSLPNPVQ